MPKTPLILTKKCKDKGDYFDSCKCLRELQYLLDESAAYKYVGLHGNQLTQVHG